MGNQNYRTPRKVIKALEDAMRCHINIDVAACKESAVAPIYITKERDAFKTGWANYIDPDTTVKDAYDYPIVFCNPPYQNVLPWVDRAIDQVEYSENLTVIMLLNAATDTKWFHTLLEHKLASIGFIRRRIAFIDPETGEPKKGNDRAQIVVLITRVEYPDAQHLADSVSKVLKEA